ncbi:MAG: cellulose-binding protein, partial [Moorea sp. SIO4G2]|nr:cellulose-binding protein [Moorena sp. SIO4G2]
LLLTIIQTDPKGTGNYIRNIRVIPEPYIDSCESLIFNPDFIDKIKPYKVLRFMDWMVTNNSEQGQWHQRPKMADSTYFAQGVPVEIMVALANQTGINPWFNMPHQATDEYVQNFAQYVKENLNPYSKVYVEFSNEVWNRRFQQSAYAIEQGKQEWPDSEARDRALGVDWYSQRTTEITQIWDNVFDTDKERVIGVMSAQAANPAVAHRALQYAWASEVKTHPEYGIDAIAIAPYFGGYIGRPDNAAEVESWTTDPDGGLNKLFEEMTTGGVLSNGPFGGTLRLACERITQHLELAKQHSLELITYEGGQHLVGVGSTVNNQAIANLLITANRDPRMGNVYREYLAIWKNLGLGLFVHYTDIGRPSKWGSWGALETIYQDASPKYDALIEFSATKV